MIRPKRAAGAVLVVLLGGVIATVVNAPTTTDPVQTFTDEGTSRQDAAPARQSSTDVTTTRPAYTVGVTSAPSLDSPESVTREALAAWGRFAASGDLAVVRAWFALDGPQYGRFAKEARWGGVGGDPYAVTLEVIDELTLPGSAQVTGRVVFVRTGEPSQSFRWSIELVRGDGRWLVWTVDEVDG